MISELVFCQYHSSFWGAIAPTTDVFIRRLNAGLYEREFPPMAASTAPGRRGFVNEVAFALFCNSVRTHKRWPPSAPTVSEIQKASASIRASVVPGEWREGGYAEDPNTDEIADIREQHKRMMYVFAAGAATDKVVPQPEFPGCGIIDSCVGDVLFSATLYEIKAGDRPFRSIDVRQLLTYAALNYFSRRYEINAVGLFNPRRGIRTEIDLGELCFEVSGQDAVSMLAEILHAISSGEISR